MNPKIIFLIISVILEVLGSYTYLRDILLKKTKPHIFSWLIWVITQGTAFVGIWYGQHSWGGYNLAFGVLIEAIIVIFSIKYGTKNITFSDTIIFIFVLGAILVWWQLDQPLISIFMVSGIDMVGYFPSCRKSFFEPWSETLSSWIILTLANVFAILALKEFNLMTMLYLTSISFANMTIVLICYLRRRTVVRPA